LGPAVYQPYTFGEPHHSADGNPDGDPDGNSDRFTDRDADSNPDAPGLPSG
jgi:hypothetical protein